MSYVVQSFSSPGEMDISPLFSSFESSNGQLSQWKGVTSGCLLVDVVHVHECMHYGYQTSYKCVRTEQKRFIPRTNRVTCFTSSCQVEI